MVSKNCIFVRIFSLQCDLHNLPTLHVLRKVDKCLEPDMTTEMSHLKHKVITNFLGGNKLDSHFVVIVFVCNDFDLMIIIFISHKQN